MLTLLLHSYGQFDVKHRIKSVVWPHFDLLYVHSGRLELRIANAADFQLKAGEGVLIYPHTPFSGDALTLRVRASVQHFSIEMPERNPVMRELANREKDFLPWRGQGAAAAAGDVDRAMSLATRPADEIIEAMRVAQLTLILGLVLQNAQHAEAKVSSGAENLHQVLAWARTRSGVLSAAELAKRAGYSRGHFRALFGQEFSGRPGAYLRGLKMNEAKRLLRESRKAIKEIAAEIGYGDVVAFHRAFARETGHTPADYRRRFSPRG